jgi:hypothetical protein
MLLQEDIEIPITVGRTLIEIAAALSRRVLRRKKFSANRKISLRLKVG